MNTNEGSKDFRIQGSWPLVDFLSTGSHFGLYSQFRVGRWRKLPYMISEITSNCNRLA